MRFFSKKEVRVNTDLYKCDRWTIWDKISEINGYKIMLKREASDLFLISLFLCLMGALVLYLIGYWDVVDLFADAICFAALGSVTYLLGGLSVIGRYKCNLEQENP